MKSLSHVRLFATTWTLTACRARLSVRFSRQEHWSGLWCPPPGDLPDSGIEPGSPALQVAEPPGKPKKCSWKVSIYCICGGKEIERRREISKKGSKKEREKREGRKENRSDSSPPLSVSCQRCGCPEVISSKIIRRLSCSSFVSCLLHAI